MATATVKRPNKWVCLAILVSVNAALSRCVSQDGSSLIVKQAGSAVPIVQCQRQHGLGLLQCPDLVFSPRESTAA